MRVTAVVEEDGRIAVPQSYRGTQGLKPGDQVVLVVNDASATIELGRPGFEPAAESNDTAPEAPIERAPAPREPMLYDLLILGPNVGEDADFERRRHPPRELPEWGT